jgi:cation diffusion facilitator family transporter
MADGSKISIYSALLGNLAVAALKFGAAALSGSTAMLTEAIHSAIDTANQLLLLFGMHRAARPPDQEHPFGHGMEIYFWTFVVSLLIFALGGAFSIYQGLLELRRPTIVAHASLGLTVIAISAVFEIASLSVSRRVTNAARPDISRRFYPKFRFLRAIHISKDPGVFEVFAEGIAAVAGLGIAALGIAGSAWLGWPQADGAASIAIGVLLAVVAVVLGAETCSLLTGEAAAKPIVDEVRSILTADGRVHNVCEVLSMHLGPQEILVAATLDFEDSLSGPQLEEAADALTDQLKAADPRITRLFIRPGRSRR